MVSIAAGHDASGHVQQTDQADVQVQTGQEGEQQAPAQGQQDQQQQTAALSGEEAENLIGKKAYGADGQEVGEVTNLLIGSDGQARAAVIEFGGFLGIGSNEVAVDWSKLQVAEDRVIVSMTEDEIKSAPKYEREQVAEQFGQDVEPVR